jgi:autotransporter-associated beta strand protein
MPDPSEPPAPTASPSAPDSSPTAAPTPGDSPAPSETPEASESAAPTASPVPSDSPVATASPLPDDTVRFIVTFRSAEAFGHLDRVVASVNADVVSEIPELHMAVLAVPTDDPGTASATISSDSAVSGVERDRERSTEAVTDDPLLSEQWSLPQIGWDQVANGPEPDGHAVVAILDTGVDADHEDLAGRLLPGVSFVQDEPADIDPNGHGTWMAGIVAARTDNGTGIAGVAFANVKVLPVTVLGADGSGLDGDIVAGLVDAVDSGADVILMSFSATGYSAALQAAVDYAWDHGAVIVAAAGNDATNAPAYPAGDRGVMGISSTDQADGLAPDSNWGDAVFLGAPGVDILTTDAGGGYASVSGTSAAAAEVAGAAALLRAEDPDATNGMTVARLARSASPAGTQAQTGNGRLDLARALDDQQTAEIEPAGVVGDADGGPFLGPYVADATRTWTGGGANGNWSTAANWGGTAPVAGDSLIFPGGAARLANTNNYTAGTTFASITISGTGYALSGNSVALGTAGLTASATGSSNIVSLPLTIAATATFNVATNATLSLTGAVSGGGGLTKSGNGTLVLGAANSYTGASTINAGTVDVQTSTGLGTTGGSASVAAGADLVVDGNGLTIAEAITLNGTGSGGAGALRNLAGANSWSGTITLGSAATIGSSAGTLTLSGADVTGGFTITIDADGDITNSGSAISGAGGLVKTGSGTLRLNVASTYTGATDIQDGTVILGATNGIGSNAAALTVAASATIDMHGFNDTVGSIGGAGDLTNDGATTSTLTSGGSGASSTFSGVASNGSGVFALTKTGAGTLTLSGANTYSGTTTISGGSVDVQSATALGSPSGGTTVATNTAIWLDGDGLLVAEPITSLRGSGISTSGSLRNLGGANTWSGSIALAGTTTFGSDAGTLTLSGGITGTRRNLTIIGAGDTVISAAIATTSGTLTKTGAGTLTLSGTNTYSGGTTVSAGVLDVQSNGALGAASTGTSVASGAAVQVDGNGLLITEPITSLIGTGVSGGGALRNLAGVNTWSGNVALGAGGATVSGDAGTFTLSGTITGNTQPLTVQGIGDAVVSGIIGTTSGTLTKNGTGMLTLSGVNTYTGATTINAGTVSINADTGLGKAPTVATAGQLTFAGGALRATTTFTLSATRGINLADDGTIDVGAGLTLTYAGAIAGTGTLVKTSAGTFSLASATGTTGGVTITGGSLVGPSAASFSVAGDWINNASATAFVPGAGSIRLNGTGPHALGGAFPTTFSGLAIADAGGISLGADATITGILTFTTGNVTTGTSSVVIAAGGSVSRTSGYVVGNLRKSVATGTPTVTYEIGDATAYAPVTLVFAAVSVAGTVTASTTAGDHPQIGTSTLDATKSLNRWWRLMTAGGLVYASYAPTFTFVAADLDAGATTSRFVAEAYSGTAWTSQVMGTRTATATQATGVTVMGDFAIGELATSALDHFSISAPASAAAGTAFSVTVTALDPVGNVVTGYNGTITFSSTDAYATFSPSTYTFVTGDLGTHAFSNGATLFAAGSRTVTAAAGAKSGVSGAITVSAGTFTKLLVLVPGQTSVPGAPRGTTGTPTSQTAFVAFSVTVLAVDAYWNPVSSTDTVGVTSSDPLAVLPANAALVAGSRTFSITLETAGTATITGRDVTNPARTSYTTDAITVTASAPVAVDDAYTVVQGNGITIAAPGVLANDTDPLGNALTVAAPRPASGPTHGSLSLQGDGSFTYTPTAGYSGTDAFTYIATDGSQNSTAATVTLSVFPTSYVPASPWSTSFSSGRYLSLAFPAYVPIGAVVSGATFTHTYRSLDGSTTTCYYIEVYRNTTLIGTHGSAASPISCASSAWVTDTVSLPEVSTVASANNLVIVLYANNSGGGYSQHQVAGVAVDYDLP